MLLTMAPTVAFAAADDEAANTISLADATETSGTSTTIEDIYHNKWTVTTAENCITMEQGDNKITATLDNAVLTVAGTGAMPVLNDSTDAVSGLQVHAYPWASWNDSVKKIVISDGITGVGSKSFIAWKNVTEVELGKDVKTIGAGALAQLTACTQFTVSNSNPYLEAVDGVLYSKGQKKLYYYPCAKSDVADLTVPDSVTELGYNDVEKTCVVKVTRKSSHSSSSGSSTTPTNTVSASTASNGKVALDKSTAKKGNTVTVTVTPDAGYQLDKLTVTDAKGNTIAVAKKGDNQYTFTMPDSKVTITPTFSKIEDTKPSKTGFNDVASSAWYADAVQYVTDKGLMNGTDDNQFSPSASTTRGMLMTVLARYAGEDTTGGATWYEKGMNWAKAKGVSDGTNPNANITREQLVTMMYRYAGSPKADGKLDSFSDAASVSTYAADAMQWAVANGIVNGSNGKLNPQNNATRAEVAAILMRFCEMSK